MSLYLFDRERVPGVSVILAILVVWGWVDAVEIVVCRLDFEDLSRGGSCGGLKLVFPRLSLPPISYISIMRLLLFEKGKNARDTYGTCAMWDANWTSIRLAPGCRRRWLPHRRAARRTLPCPLHHAAFVHVARR